MKQIRLMEWVLEEEVERRRGFYKDYHSLIPWVIAG